MLVHFYMFDPASPTRITRRVPAGARGGAGPFPTAAAAPCAAQAPHGAPQRRPRPRPSQLRPPGRQRSRRGGALPARGAVAARALTVHHRATPAPRTAFHTENIYGNDPKAPPAAAPAAAPEPVAAEPVRRASITESVAALGQRKDFTKIAKVKAVMDKQDAVAAVQMRDSGHKAEHADGAFAANERAQQFEKEARANEKFNLFWLNNKCVRPRPCPPRPPHPPVLPQGSKRWAGRRWTTSRSASRAECS